MARASSALLKRRLDIAEIVRKQGEVKVDELSELLNVSGVTIRQDLTYLEQQGYLKRSFGGAIYISSDTTVHSGQGSSRLHQNNIYSNDCIDLVKQSLNYIHDGDTLFLSNGSLLRKLIPFLYDKKSLKIIVNDIANAQLAKEFTEAEIIIVGGELMDNNTIHSDKMMGVILSLYPVSHFIVEVVAITNDNQLVIEDVEQINHYRQVTKNAEQTIAIVSPKVINDEVNSIGKLKDIDVAILSRSAVSSYHQQLLDCHFTQMDSSKYSMTYQNKQET